MRDNGKPPDGKFDKTAFEQMIERHRVERLKKRRPPLVYKSKDGISTRTWPVDKWSNVDCCEVNESLQEKWDGEEFSATVTLKCAWDDRHDLIQDIRDTSAYPYFRRNNDGDVCEFDNATITPFFEKVATTTGDGMYMWENALVTVNFTTKRSWWHYLEIFEPSVEFRILDYNDFVWLDGTMPDNLKPKEAPGLQIRGSMYAVQIFNIPDDEMYQAQYAGHVGCVNDKQLRLKSLAWLYEKEQLLLLPAQVNRRLLTNDPWNSISDISSQPVFWDMTIKYAIRDDSTDDGWNKFWRNKSSVASKHEYIYPKHAGAYTTTETPYHSYELKNIEQFLPTELYALS